MWLFISHLLGTWRVTQTAPRWCRCCFFNLFPNCRASFFFLYLFIDFTYKCIPCCKPVTYTHRLFNALLIASWQNTVVYWLHYYSQFENVIHVTRVIQDDCSGYNKYHYLFFFLLGLFQCVMSYFVLIYCSRYAINEHTIQRYKRNKQYLHAKKENTKMMRATSFNPPAVSGSRKRI